MNIVDMIYSGIQTDLLGKLSFKCSLIEYDYPRCFICKNEKNEYYALMENDFNPEHLGWNVSKVDLNDINYVNKGEKNVQSLFINKEIFLLSFGLNQSVGKIIKIDRFPEKLEIKGDYFVNDFCDMDELFDFHGLSKTAREKNKCSLSIVFEKNELIKTNAVYHIINYLSKMCLNFSDKIDFPNSIFSVQQGSAVVTFTFEKNVKGPLFEDDESVDEDYFKGIQQLGNVLSANNAENLAVETKNETVAKNYSKLINVFSSNTKTKPKIVISTPKQESSISYNYNDVNCKSKKMIIKETESLLQKNKYNKEEKIKVKGILTGILTDKKEFSFLDNDGRKFEGMVDFNLLQNKEGFLVNAAIYEAIILETDFYNIDKLIKKAYKLLSLTFIENAKPFEQIDLFNNKI